MDINYPYLTGYLESTLKRLPHALAREGIIKFDSKTYQKISEQVEKELAKALKAEREFSTTNPQ